MLFPLSGRRKEKCDHVSVPCWRNLATHKSAPRLGRGPPRQQIGHITLLGHEYLPASDWFPTDEFDFNRPFTPETVGEALRRGGPDEVFTALVDGLQERVGAQVAVLVRLAEAASADLACTNTCAPLLRSVEQSHLDDRPSPTFVADGASLLTTTALRHALAITDLEALPIEQVAEVANRCKSARIEFSKVVRHYADEVAEVEDPIRAAARAAKKHLLPELEGFDKRFGAPLRTLKSYARDTLDPKTLLTALPLAAFGAAQSFNTAWTLGVGAAVSAAKTTKERRRWPRLLIELRRLHRSAS